MAASRPVFVAGVPRSGTTALRAALDRHPTFRAREDVSPETKIFAEPDQLRGLSEPGSARLREYLLHDEAELESLRRSLSQVVASKADSILVALLQRLRLASLRAPMWRLRAGHHRLRVFFHHASRARAVSRILEKTPVHMEFLPEMRATFPRMQVVLCIRHPVEVYSSYRKKLFKAEQRNGVLDKHRWLTISVERFCARYREWSELARVSPDAWPEGVLLVRYEDLTADPRRELARICTFLGEPFEEAAIFDDVPVQRDDYGSPRPGAKIVANEKVWRDFIPQDEAETLERELSAEMQYFGYEPLTGRVGE